MVNPLLKVAISIALVSFVINGVQFFNNSRLESSLSLERGKVTALVEDNARLEQNERYAKAICNAEQEALRKKLEKAEQIEAAIQDANKSLSELRTKEGNNTDENNKQDNKDTLGINYGPELARVLNNACKQIFGQDCPNPK